MPDASSTPRRTPFVFEFLSRTKRANALAKQGVEHVDAGRFDAAAKSFQGAIQLEPRVASHRVNLAYAAQQRGAARDAHEALEHAVALDPASFDAQFMLGLALESSGRPQEACVHLRHAVALQPESDAASVELARMLVQTGDGDAAREVLTTALMRRPDSATLHLALGNTFMDAGCAVEALEPFRRALDLEPVSPVALSNLAMAHHALERYDEAVAGHRAAIDSDPNMGAAYEGLGRALHVQGRWQEAEAAWRSLLALRPEDAEAWNSLGTVLHASGRTEEAMAAYSRAIALRPDEPGAYANLGLAYADAGDPKSAVLEYRKALAIKDVAEAHDNLGIALHRLGAADEAIDHYRKALALNPHNLNTQSNLAAVLADGGHPRESIAAYRDLLNRHPDRRTAHSNLLLHLSIDDDTPSQAYLDEARRYGEVSAAGGAATMTADRRHQDRRLRIGFVSGDLRTHPVGFFLEGILQHLDRSRLSLYAYPTTTRRDDLTERIAPVFDSWRSIKGLSDQAAAEAIRTDGIDVLVDLAGHTGDNGLQVFARRAAPVQITWLGYFASTGVQAMDYVLADEFCVPPGAEWQFSERIWRLPRTRLCYTPPPESVAPAVAPSPAASEGFVTFGSFQRLGKLTDRVLALWGHVMEAVPTARLRLQAPQTGRQRFVRGLLDRLAAVGIDAGRVAIRPPSSRREYMEAYAEVDIVLDTFPYTGGTTTCEALWMGVPTLTLAGDTMISRQGVAMLQAAGLPEWIATTQDDYVKRAVRHASDIAALAALRAGLRESVRSTPLFDVRRFATHLTEAFDAMHAESAAGARG